jgi:hypothetical protein
LQLPSKTYFQGNIMAMQGFCTDTLGSGGKLSLDLVAFGLEEKQSQGGGVAKPDTEL